VAEVEVDDLGEKKNSDISSRFGLSRNDFPKFVFFPQGSTQHTAVPNPSSADDLVHFVLRHGVRMALNGTIAPLEAIAKKMVGGGDVRALLAEAEAAAAELVGADSSMGYKGAVEYYLKVLQKVAAEGGGFLVKETKRVEKMVADKGVAKDKKALFSERLNILLGMMH
jgi:hypothetical protein